ncbi:MAG TPA: hypothetical protein VMA37_04745 [Acetobacteraceae bacterium]|nr:hypothetical protein [Acetobacteraceae bacterium]
MVKFAVAALVGGLFLAGCAQQAPQPVVSLAGAQAEASAILAALQAGAAVFTTTSTTTSSEAQAVENVLATAEAAVSAFVAAPANESPAQLAETASEDITAVLAALPIDPTTKTAIDTGLAVIDALVAESASVPSSAAPAGALSLAVTEPEKLAPPVPIPAPHVLPPRV